MNRPISRNALIKRVRRALRRWNWFLVIARGDWYQNDQKLGSHYVIDFNGNVQDHHCDLESLARDLRVLRDGEMVDDTHDGGEALDYPTGIKVILQINAALCEKERLARHQSLAPET